MKPIIALMLGDPGGIGPELVAKSAANGFLTANCRPLIIGSRSVWDHALSLLGKTVDYAVAENENQITWEKEICLLDLKTPLWQEIEVGSPQNKLHGEDMVRQINLSIDYWKRGVVNSVCFGPYTKASLKAYLGNEYPSELEYFAELLEHKGPLCEVNHLDNIFTTRATSHIPMTELKKYITEDVVLDGIRLLHKTILSAGIKEPRIGVAALNPHGGEAGTCGREEIDIIAPAMEKAAKEGIKSFGPYPADTIFKRAIEKKEFDGVMTMYHDQGQIALKLLGFERGVTIQGGLDCPITTPAHGSALDIAGKGVATTGAFEKALLDAVAMATV